MKLVFNLALRPGAYQEASTGKPDAHKGARAGEESSMGEQYGVCTDGESPVEAWRGSPYDKAQRPAICKIGPGVVLFCTCPSYDGWVCAALSNYQDAARHLQLALALDTGNTNYRSFLLEMQRKIRGL